MEFKISFTDSRFPHITVFSDGSHIFQVMRKNKYVDSFMDYEYASSKRVSIAFAEAKAKDFFQKLSEHPWLNTYYTRWFA